MAVALNCHNTMLAVVKICQTKNINRMTPEKNCLRCGKPESQHYEKDNWNCYTWDNFFLEIAKLHYSEREQWAKDNYTVPIPKKEHYTLKIK